MSKKIRLISLLLCIALTVGALSMSAFAEKEEFIYTVLGDSNASGYGLDSYFENAGKLDVKDGDLIDGSYPALLADALGIKSDNVSVHAHCGWRTADFLREIKEFSNQQKSENLQKVLDQFVYGEDNPTDKYSDHYGKNYFRQALYFIDKDVLNGEGDAIINSIRKADLITLDIGTNDLFSYGLTVTVNKLGSILEDSGITNIEDAEDFCKALRELLTLADEEEVNGIFSEIVKAIETGMAMFKQNIPLVIDAIQSINPDAELVVVGIANPINIVLGDRLPVDLLQLSDLTVYRTNQFTKEICKERNCIFADVTGADVFGIEALDTELLFAGDENVKYSAVKMLHQSEKGHAFKAEKILDAMNTASNRLKVNVTKERLTFKTINSITWNQINDAKYYKIYRSKTEDGKYTYIGASLNTSYKDLIAVKQQTYFYKVEACMKSGSSVFSASVTAK